MKLLPQHDYIKTVRRPYPILFMSMILDGLCREDGFTTLLGAPFAIRNFVRHEEVWYYSRAETEQLGRLAFAHWNHAERLEHTREEFRRREENLLGAVHSPFADFQAAFRVYMPILISVYSVEDLVDKHLSRLLESAFSSPEASRLRRLLNTTEEDNYFKAQEYDLVTTKDLTDHVKQYEWLHSRYGSENPLTLEDVERQLSLINTSEFLKRYHQEKADARAAADAARRALGENAHAVDLFQYLIFYRTHRTDIINRVLYEYVPSFKQLAATKGIDYDDLLRCTVSEVTGVPPGASELLARRQSHAFVLADGEITLLSGKNVTVLAEHFKELPPLRDSVSGDVACEGSAKGLARIVMNAADYHKVQAGDVLVTSMTTPDMFPIMKRAAAFLTDEGGVTCHAAIVARELQKPCIIGTRFATQVFRDGDVVVFDTTRGIAKRIPAADAGPLTKTVIWVIDDVADVRREIRGALQRVLGESSHYRIDASFRDLNEPIKELKAILRDRSRWSELPAIIITDLFLEKSWRDGIDVLRKINRSLSKISDLVPQLREHKISVFVFSYFRRFITDEYAGDAAVEADYAGTIGKLELLSIPPDQVLDKEKPEFYDDARELVTDGFKAALNDLAVRVKRRLEATDATDI